MNGYCIRYSDNKGDIDVTFFCPIVTNLMNISEIEMVRLMFFNAHPTWTILDIHPCSLLEFQSIARIYG